jgi:hypothetical protein
MRPVASDHRLCQGAGGNGLASRVDLPAQIALQNDTSLTEANTVPGGVIAVQTFGDSPDRVHPHLHILKVCETDPLVCPQCEHPMRVIASIEAPKVIRRILEHLGLWGANARSEPRAHSPPVRPFSSEAFFSQLPAFEEEDFSQIPHENWER